MKYCLLLFTAFFVLSIAPLSAKTVETDWTEEEKILVTEMEELSEQGGIEALPELENLSESIRLKKGADSKIYAESVFFIALNNFYNGQHVKAESEMERSLSLYRKALPPGDPFLALMLHSAADIYLTDDRIYSAPAEKHLREALVIRERYFKNPHTDLNGNRLTLVETLLVKNEEGNLVEAYSVLQKGEEDIKKLAKEEPDDLARYYYSAIKTSFKMGKPEQAILHLNKVKDCMFGDPRVLMSGDFNSDELINLLEEHDLNQEAYLLQKHIQISWMTLGEPLNSAKSKNICAS